MSRSSCSRMSGSEDGETPEDSGNHGPPHVAGEESTPRARWPHPPAPASAAGGRARSWRPQGGRRCGGPRGPAWEPGGRNGRCGKVCAAVRARGLSPPIQRTGLGPMVPASPLPKREGFLQRGGPAGRWGGKELERHGLHTARSCATRSTRHRAASSTPGDREAHRSRCLRCRGGGGGSLGGAQGVLCAPSPRGSARGEKHPRPRTAG